MSPPELERNAVDHKYADHANEKYDPSLITQSPFAATSICLNSLDRKDVSGGLSFPVKLFELLERIDQDGLAHVISWQSHGRCFVVHNPQRFVEILMPFYFKQTKFASFQRQLNLYGFNRLTSGPDKGGYYHECFLRGRKHLVFRIQRLKIKGTGVRKASSPETEPQFYRMPPVSPQGHSTASTEVDKSPGWSRETMQGGFKGNLVLPLNFSCETHSLVDRPSRDVMVGDDASTKMSSNYHAMLPAMFHRLFYQQDQKGESLEATNGCSDPPSINNSRARFCPMTGALSIPSNGAESSPDVGSQNEITLTQDLLCDSRPLLTRANQYDNCQIPFSQTTQSATEKSWKANLWRSRPALYSPTSWDECFSSHSSQSPMGLNDTSDSDDESEREFDKMIQSLGELSSETIS